MWNGVLRNTTGKYLDTFTTFLGCDSIVSLALIVSPVKYSSFNATICSNQFYLWNGILRNISGAFLDTFPSYLGCDSIVTLNLQANPIKASKIRLFVLINLYFGMEIL
jgi:hypothetical protein